MVAKQSCFQLFWHDSKACVILNYMNYNVVQAVTWKDAAGSGCATILCPPSLKGISNYACSSDEISSTSDTKFL